MQSAREAKVQILLGAGRRDGHPHVGTIDFADNRVDAMTGNSSAACFRIQNGLSRRGCSRGSGRPSAGRIRRIPSPRGGVGFRRGASRQVCLIVNDKNEAEDRGRVQIGSLHGTLRVIESGVAEADRVVLAAAKGLQPGIAVQPKDAEATK